MEDDREPNYSAKDKKGGLGVLLGAYKDGYFELQGVRIGSPCQRAGIQNGDRIIQLEGKSLKGLNSAEVTQLARGTVGSKVKLKILKEDGSERNILLERVDMTNDRYARQYYSDYQHLSHTARSLDTAYGAEGEPESAIHAGDFIGARALSILALDRIVGRNSASNPTVSTLLTSAAKYFISAGCFDKAEQLLDEIERLSNEEPPSGDYDPHNLNSFAELLESTGRIASASHCYERLIERFGKRPEYIRSYQATLERYCRFLIRNNRAPEATRFLRLLESHYGEKLTWRETEFFADTEYAAGEFLQSSKRYEKAAAEYEQSAQQDRQLIKLLYKAADAAYAGKEFHRAQKINAKTLDKHRATTPPDLEQRYERKQDFQPAMSQLLVQEGDIRRAIGKTEGATDSYKKALEFARLAFVAESSWCKVIEARLGGAKNSLPERKINLDESQPPRRIEEWPTKEPYLAIKSKAADRIKLANECLNKMQLKSGGRLSTYQIAQFFALIELERENSAINALDLLTKLEQLTTPSQTIEKLTLLTYRTWLVSTTPAANTDLQESFDLLNKLTEEVKNIDQEGVPCETLRWLALSWRFAEYPKIANMLLTKAIELRNNETAPTDADEQKQLLRDFDLRNKEDQCLILINLHKYAEAEKIAFDPTIIYSASGVPAAKWPQICKAFEEANHEDIAERILLAIANVEQTHRKTNPEVLLHLAKLYLNRGKFPMAEEFANKALAAQKVHHSVKGYDVLAEALDKQNKLNKAIQAYLQAASDRDFQHSIQSRENKLGYLWRVLEIQEKMFGPNDPQLVATLTLLTAALQRSGNPSQVKQISDRIFQIESRNFKTPFEELKFWKQMATNYTTSKEPEKAIEAQRQVAQLAERNNIRWGREYQHLAQLELAQKQYDLALNHAKKYLASPSYLSDCQDTSLLTSIGGPHNRFTDELIESGFAPEALELLGLAGEIARSNYCEYDKSVTMTRAAIAKAQAKSKDYLGCEETCRQALNTLEKSRLNEPNVDRHSSRAPIECFQTIAEVLSEQMQYDQAVSLLQRIHEIQSKYLGKKNTLIASTEFDISRVLVKQKKFLEAKVHAWNALQIYETNYGREWHALDPYVSVYLDILRQLNLKDEIASIKDKYREDFDFYEQNENSNSDLALSSEDYLNPKQGRSKLLDLARAEEKLSGPYSRISRDILSKLIQLETHAENYELVLDLQERVFQIISLLDSPEGLEARRQLGEIVETNLKLGRNAEALKVTAKIVSILESIPEDAHNPIDKFTLVKSYIFLGEKSKALSTLTKLREKCKNLNSDTTALKQCAKYYAQLGETKEFEVLNELADNIWRREQEERDAVRRKRINDN